MRQLEEEEDDKGRSYTSTGWCDKITSNTGKRQTLVAYAGLCQRGSLPSLPMAHKVGGLGYHPRDFCFKSPSKNCRRRRRRRKKCDASTSQSNNSGVSRKRFKPSTSGTAMVALGRALLRSCRLSIVTIRDDWKCRCWHFGNPRLLHSLLVTIGKATADKIIETFVRILGKKSFRIVLFCL